MEPRVFDPDAAAAFDGIYGLPHTPEEAKVVLIPVPWDATVSYRPGAAEGPRAILEASRQVDLFDRETGRPYESGIAMLPIPEDIRGWSIEARVLAAPIIEIGGIEGVPEGDPRLAALREQLAEVDDLGVRMNAWVYAESRRWLDEGKLIGVVGGDHASPYGAIRAISEKYPGVGILHLDAHCDLRRAYEGFRWSHASIFWNVYYDLLDVSRIVQVGLRDYGSREDELIRFSGGRIVPFFDADLRRRLHEGERWIDLAREIVERLPERVYLSFDIDGLDPVLCPNTGTPVPGGLSFAEATSLVRLTVESGRKIVGFDLCEVAPDPTGASEWDGNVASRLLYKMIGFALRS